MLIYDKILSIDLLHCEGFYLPKMGEFYSLFFGLFRTSTKMKCWTKLLWKNCFFE